MTALLAAGAPVSISLRAQPDAYPNLCNVSCNTLYHAYCPHSMLEIALQTFCKHVTTAQKGLSQLVQNF